MATDNEFSPLLGIDLGTTFSAIAKWDGSGSKSLPAADGGKSTQSAVYFEEGNGSCIVGKVAYSRYLLAPDNGIVGVKRRMDTPSEKIVVGGKEYTPVEISSKILEKVYQDVVGRYPQGKFASRGVVVTVPYYFKAHQCESTRRAVELAGLPHLLGILQEPVAAALSYCLDLAGRNINTEETVMVFDLGGGTFDLTLFKLKIDPKNICFEALGTGGDDRLGGMDFTDRLMQHVIARTGANFDGLDSRPQKLANKALWEAANTAKELLSFTTNADFIAANLPSGGHIDEQISRAEFENCIESYVEEVRGIVRDTFTKCGVQPKSIDKVLKVGGSSKIPIFSETILAGIGADKIYGTIDPETCVAEGAAIYALYAEDPDVGILGRKIDIKTVNCHSVGIAIKDGKFFPLILDNRRLPYQRTQTFTTVTDNQTQLEVHVYQGGGKLVKDNSLVGQIAVRDLPKKKRGELEIKITFKMNELQNITVTIEVPEIGRRVTEALRLQA